MMGVTEEDKSKKEKQITATQKGAAVLDQWLPDDIKSLYHVLQDVFPFSYIVVFSSLFSC